MTQRGLQVLVRVCARVFCLTPWVTHCRPNGPGMVLDADAKQALPQELKARKPLALVQLALAEGVDKTLVDKTQIDAETDAEARSGLIALIVAHRTFSAMAHEEAQEGVRQPKEAAAVRSYPLAAVLAALSLPAEAGSVPQEAEASHRWERVHQCLHRWVASATYLAVAPRRAPGRFEGVQLSFMPPPGRPSALALPSSVPAAAAASPRADWGAGYAPRLAAARAQYPNVATMRGETQDLVAERDRLVQSVAQVRADQSDPVLQRCCMLYVLQVHHIMDRPIAVARVAVVVLNGIFGNHNVCGQLERTLENWAYDEALVDTILPPGAPPPLARADTASTQSYATILVGVH